MEMRENWLRAIDARTSRRTYREEKIDQQKARQIQLLVNECNAEGGLNILFIEDGASLFNSFKSSYGMFSGVQSYFAMVGDKAMPCLMEKIGYYGELLVLECTDSGLGTCWVAGTYNKEECKKQLHLKDEEELICVIPVGYVKQEKSLKEKAISLSGRKTKKFEVFIAPSTGLPDWAVKGVEAVMKAPSAINKQPARFAYKTGAVKATVENLNSIQAVDLGIAKAHFELGAWGAGSKGKWIQQDGDSVFQ